MIKEENINCTLEALVLASPEPVSLNKLSEVMDGVSPARIRQAVSDLNNLYMGCGLSFRIREVAGGYQVHILPDFEQVIKNMLSRQRSVRLTRAALETLAIVAYKQPVTKTEIEHIRGVSSDGVLHNLLERKLIVIAGRSEGPGRPLLYKTSSEFLKFFGLNRLTDLPRIEEIEEMIREAEPSRDQTEFDLPGEDAASTGASEFETGDEDSAIDDETDDMVAHADVETDTVEGTQAGAGEDPELQDDENGLDDTGEFNVESAFDKRDYDSSVDDGDMLEADSDPDSISEMNTGGTIRDDGSDDGGNGSGKSDTGVPASDLSSGATDEEKIPSPADPRLSAVIYFPGDEAVVDIDSDDESPEVSVSPSSPGGDSSGVSEASDRRSLDE